MRTTILVLFWRLVNENVQRQSFLEVVVASDLTGLTKLKVLIYELQRSVRVLSNL